MSKYYYLAIDIGAGSGRHIVGHADDNGDIVTEEVYRFANGMDKTEDGHLVWNIEKLFTEVKNGIKAALAQFPKIESLAIDTWGVDYALLDSNEKIIPPMYAYRDDRGGIAAQKVHKIVPFEEIYASSGEQYQAFNTVYQLYDDKLNGRLASAKHFLMVPEYLNYLLTGKIVKEYTMATTTGIVNAKSRKFDLDIVKKLDLPEELFEELHFSGEVVGGLTKDVQAEVGGNITVKLCPSHDTACAFEAIPSKSGEVVISSGTWSLVGVKIPEPNTSKASMDRNFANEGGVNYIRYLKNVTGLWLIACLKKEFNLGFEAMVELAEKSSFSGIFDVNDVSFTAPESMQTAIKDYFSTRGKSEPITNGDFCNSVYLSLANSYLKVVNEIEDVLGIKVNKVYIVGGGAKNELLNKYAHKALNREVVPMPIEATAIGNILSQTYKS